ncbi:hypothetical protein AB4Y88_00050 [Paenarthrobacter sp. RAF9]
MDSLVTCGAPELRRPEDEHLVRWCARFKISPTEAGFATESGHTVYPALAITETDGTIRFSAPAYFEHSGIRGHIETRPAFRDMLNSIGSDPEGGPDGLLMIINNKRFQVIFQNLHETGANHIINVAFIDRSSGQLVISGT